MNTDPRAIRGHCGEDVAAAFFLARGFRILDRNWRCALGEIDLVVERANEVRFIEVKTRSSTVYGYPEEAVTRKKIQHLCRAIELWLRSKGRQSKRYQADVLTILILPGKEPEIRWIEAIG